MALRAASLTKSWANIRHRSLETYDVLIKTYNNPFWASNHGALGPSDCEMTVWKGPRLELIG
jgi:hypothetical protein